MTAELNEQTLCDLITETLTVTSKEGRLSSPVTMETTMDNLREWDSLSFVAVFNSVSEAFDVELDEDDAINFRGMRSMYDFLREILD